MPAPIFIGQPAAVPQQTGPDPRSRMVRKASCLFEALATERPFVLVLEDLHWADFATIDLLSALCRRRSSANLLLIATYRPEDLATARHPLKQMTYEFQRAIESVSIWSTAASVCSARVPKMWLRPICSERPGRAIFAYPGACILSENSARHCRIWMPISLPSRASAMPPRLIIFRFIAVPCCITPWILRASCGPAAAHPPEHRRTPATEKLPLKYRIALIFCDLADAGLGRNSAAFGHLRAAEVEMGRQPAHLDCYWRLPLEWGMVNVLIADGDHPTALSRAERLCDLAAQTDERTWQALAWEAYARAALSCGEAVTAGAHVEKALAACEGVQVPLAEWRVHATCAITFTALGDDHRAGTHRQLGAAVRKRLAESLPEGHPVRVTFECRSGSLCKA
jgi:hypothetical protein